MNNTEIIKSLGGILKSVTDNANKTIDDLSINMSKEDAEKLTGMTGELENMNNIVNQAMDEVKKGAEATKKQWG